VSPNLLRRIVDDDPYKHHLQHARDNRTAQGIVHTHYITRHILHALLLRPSDDSGERDTSLRPMFSWRIRHAHARRCIWVPKYVLQKGFDPRTFVETVRRESVTHVMMVPSQIVALLGSPYFSTEDLKSLENDRHGEPRSTWNIKRS